MTDRIFNDISYTENELVSYFKTVGSFLGVAVDAGFPIGSIEFDPLIYHYLARNTTVPESIHDLLDLLEKHDVSLASSLRYIL